MKANCARLSGLILAIVVSFGGRALAADSLSSAYAIMREPLQRSAVPVLVPTRLPSAVGTIVSVAVITADRTGYYIGFSPVRHCSGALSCAILHVAGYLRTSPAGRTFGNDRPIRLPDGSRGYYTAHDCSGSSCAQASLTFQRSGMVYEIDANAARNDLPVLVSVYRALRYADPHWRTAHGR